MLTVQESYDRAMEEISRGFRVNDVKLETSADPYDGNEKKYIYLVPSDEELDLKTFTNPYDGNEKKYVCLVSDGKELICRVEKGTRVGFFRITNAEQALAEHYDEIYALLKAGIVWYSTEELSTPA